jgi:hypothetical protein
MQCKPGKKMHCGDTPAATQKQRISASAISPVLSSPLLPRESRLRTLPDTQRDVTRTRLAYVGPTRQPPAPPRRTIRTATGRTPREPSHLLSRHPPQSTVGLGPHYAPP